MSLYKWGGFSNNKVFVGLENFKILWNDMNFFRSLQNSIVLIVIVTLITMVMAILFATLLTREKIKGKASFELFLYPNILSVVVIAGIFSAVYDPTTGLLNNLLALFNLEHLQKMWLGNQKLPFTALAGHSFGKRLVTIWSCIWRQWQVSRKVFMKHLLWKVLDGSDNF